MDFKDYVIIFFLCVGLVLIMIKLGKQGTPTIEIIKRIEKVEKQLELKNE
jgi:hypothetical protein